MLPTDPEQRRLGWRWPLLLTVVLRIVYSVIGAVFSWLSPPYLKLMRSNAFTETLPPLDHSAHSVVLDVWNRFDTLWYLHIAQHGYDRPEATVFFPVYPLLIRLMGRHLISALCVSTLATFFMFWAFQQLLRKNFPTDTVQKILLICAVWPGSFIYFAGYAESLLLAFILSSLHAARNERWWLAALLAFLACGTKAAGILVLVPLLILAWQSGSLKALWLLLAPSGLVSFMVWLRHRGFESLADIYAQYWHTELSFPWATLWHSLRAFYGSHDILLGLNLFCLFFVAWLIFLSRSGVAYVSFGVSALVLFLTKRTDPLLQSTMRYSLIIFPAYIGWERWLENPKLRPRFGISSVVLFIANLGLLWLFLGWSLVL